MSFDINLEAHLLQPARFVPSPHCDQRPANMAIELLVIHNISLPPGEYAGRYVEDFFLGKLSILDHPYFETIAHLHVSAHLFIRRTGEVIQFVPFHQRAWHAGKSCFRSREACNDFSIGIELEGSDHEPFDDMQYKILVEVTRCLMNAYQGIKMENIVGHSDIAPDRKTDPGPYFDWARYQSLLRQSLS